MKLFESFYWEGYRMSNDRAYGMMNEEGSKSKEICIFVR